MKIIAKFKSWQLFIIFVLPYYLASNSILGHIIISLSFSLLIAYIYAIGILMHSLLPSDYKPGALFFKINSLFLVIVIGITVIGFGGVYIDQNNYRQFGNSIWFLVPLLLCCFFSMAYIIYFASKMFESAIAGKIVGIDKYYKAFLALWIYPIGVWFIQPVIREMFDEK